jgi:rod shape-determining protein MreD
MRFRTLIYTICILFFLLLQSTWLDYIKINGVKPNLILIFTVIVALLRGYTEGAVVGFFAGIALDLLHGRFIGFYALLGLYLGLAVGYSNRRLYKENYLVMIVFIFVSTTIYEFLVYFFSSLGTEMNFNFAFKGNIIPEAIYNCFVAVIIYFFAIKLNSKFLKSEKK